MGMIMPKLPCRFRTNMRKCEKNQRCKDLFKRSKSGRPTSWQNSIRLSVQMLLINQYLSLLQCHSRSQELCTASLLLLLQVMLSVKYHLELDETRKKRENGQRGKDGKIRRPRRCKLCAENGGPHFNTWKGRSPNCKCQHFSPY